jgi:hypothetical protein
MSYDVGAALDPWYAWQRAYVAACDRLTAVLADSRETAAPLGYVRAVERLAAIEPGPRPAMLDRIIVYPSEHSEHVDAVVAAAETPRRYHEDGCALAGAIPDHPPPCRDLSGADLTIPF